MFSRHDLVWLTGRGWDAALARALPGQHATIEQWRRQNWPAIVRRLDTGLEPGHVSLGIAPAPAPDGSKRRIAFNAHVSDVARSTPALPLADAAKAAPAHWHGALDALLLQTQEIKLRAYGSLAMQAITGQPYLTLTSDIDLLFIPVDAPMLHAGIALLKQAATVLPLDGEIVFPSGDAVAWKEWVNAEAIAARVLVKHANAVRLAPMVQLLTTLAAA